MNVKSVYRFARISPFKTREVTREIQGLPATDAMDLLRFVPKKAAGLVRKTLASAIANAENNNNLNPEDLTVLEAVVGEGPTSKRFRPRARGSAGMIRKRTSHIRIVVTDDIAIERREKPAKKKKKGRKSGASPSKSVTSTPDPEATHPADASEPSAPESSGTVTTGSKE